MIDLLETIQHALVAYWSSPLPLTVMAVIATGMGTLLYVFVTNARNAKLRVSLLTGLYALSIFLWTFVSVSLVLCVSQAKIVAYSTQGVPLAVGGASLGGIGASALISYIIWKHGNAAIMRRFSSRPLRQDEQWLQAYTDLLTDFEGIPRAHVQMVESGEVVAIALGGSEQRVLVSQGLVHLLDRDEVEPVIAHEIMHLKHHDAQFKVFSRVFSRVLFFDPFSKFFTPAVHREREYLADEAGARATGKPSSLASALLKIASHGPSPKTVTGLSIMGAGKGVFSMYPPLSERVRRLLLLAELLNLQRGNN